MIAAIYIAVTVTRSISVPINELKREMTNTENNLEFRIRDQYQDEISLLGRKIKEMVDRIKHLISEIHQNEIEKSKNEINLRNAQYHALLNQINPHFIYNTMELIRAEIVLSDINSKAPDMIESFSALLRIGTLKLEDLVTLSEELEHIRMYAAVLGFSEYYQDMTLDINVDDALKQNLIPKLTLQPIIENCIKHGFEKRQRYKVIRISGRMNEGVMEISIADNGKPIDPEDALRINEQIRNPDRAGSSIGLNNVNDRIGAFFGMEFGVSVCVDREKEIIIRLPPRKREGD
jgi:sensor histidine kinase YesM